MDAGVRERGQVLPLVMVVLAVALMATLLVARVAGAVQERERARTASDAAALAGAAEGRRRAEALAESNGASLERYVEAAGQVEVTVRVGGTSATARAASRPG